MSIVNGENKDADAVHYVSKFGGFVKGLFAGKSKKKDKYVVSGEPISFVTSFGWVYANESAKKTLDSSSERFPEGAIFVREKLTTKTSKTPEKVVAMVKREKGFSEATDDWEFFAFNGSDFLLEKRETIGSCATCHSNSKKSDWVFSEGSK